MSEQREDGADSFRAWFRDRWRIIDLLPATREGTTGGEEEPGVSVEGSEDQPLTTEVRAQADAEVETSAQRERAAYIETKELEGASKWAAGGFSAAAALLVFFGVKEGVLDQALRLYPLPTLCVFMLLGVGVLSALFAGAIKPIVHIRLWAIIVAVAVMVGLTALYLPNLDVIGAGSTEDGAQDTLSSWSTVFGYLAVGFLAAAAITAVTAFFAWRSSTLNPLAIGLAVVLIAIVLLAGVSAAIVSADRQKLLALLVAMIFVLTMAWSFVKMASLPAIASIVILGVTATSLGLYGIAKLSVQSKMLAVKPQVSASLEQVDGETSLKIVARASRMRDRKLLVSVAGEPRREEVQSSEPVNASDEEIWWSVLEPNSLDEIDTTVTVPLMQTRWEFLTVFYCRVHKQSSYYICNGQPGSSQVLHAGNLMPPGAEITGHIVAASAKSLRVTLTGRNVAWGNRVEAEICRVRRGGHARRLATATLAPEPNGSVAWTVPVPAGGDGEGLVLLYKQCRRGAPCPKDMKRLAEYTLP
jgi:hypothetical protein